MITDSLILELQRATHATLSQVTSELVDLGLTASEINALGNLADGAGRRVSELAAAVGVRATTLTGVLDRLEHRGLVTRTPRPGDRRAVLVQLTAEGRGQAARIRRTFDAVQQRALGHMSGRTLAQARVVLRALAEVGG